MQIGLTPKIQNLREESLLGSQDQDSNTADDLAIYFVLWVNKCAWFANLRDWFNISMVKMFHICLELWRYFTCFNFI